MFRRFSEPLRSNYETEEEYQEELDAWDFEQVLREAYLLSKKITTTNHIAR